MIPEHYWHASARRLRRNVFFIKEGDRVAALDSTTWVRNRLKAYQPYLKGQVQISVQQLKSNTDVQTFISSFSGINEPGRLGVETSD